jgi:multimeric flavodoxin WrbA
MKALLINGSPHKNGTTKRALEEVKKPLLREGFDCEIYDIESETAGCKACGFCKKAEKCIINDGVNQVLPLFEAADVLIIGSPVYYASPNGSLLAFLDRLFYSSKCDKRMKVGASVAVARRGGLTATFDVLNKYFSISEMPIATSSYWNQVHGAFAEDAKEDLEGLRTVRTLARNMTFLMRAISLGKEELGLPEREPKVFTNFVRR